MVKTFTMFSGEIDYNFIFPPFDPSKHDLPKFLYQIYLGTFIFFIAIALNNFLNAVAVSDVALLKEESELTNEIQRVDIILNYEELSQRYVRSKETRIDRWPIMSNPTINAMFLDSPIGGDRNSAIVTISIFTQLYYTQFLLIRNSVKS